MSTVIPPRELDEVLDALDELSLEQLKVFVATARATTVQTTNVQLGTGGTAREQFRADAAALNRDTERPRALNAWLKVASLQLGQDEPARDVREKNFAPGRTPTVGPLAIPEKIILRDDTVPFDWVRRAAEAGDSIAWVATPRFIAGQQSNGEANGTGLRIDERHLMTCRHVLEAREPGESKPDAGDLALQVAGTRVAFGYLTGPKPQVTVGVVKLVVSDAALDYAVVELDSSFSQNVPTLYTGELPQPMGDNTFVVNILQHPGGRPKRIAMRNNAVARVDDERIAYWTDTDYGSSGAPVFDDNWRVIALHRAYEERTGLQYLGRSVAGANVGSRITRIVAHIEANAPQLLSSLKITDA